MTSAEGTITSQASDITTLQSDLTTAEGNITTNATAVSGLDTRVTTAEGNITSNASSISSLTSTINDPSTGLAATATVASGASTTAAANATAITDLEAEAFLTVSAGGNISGFKATADASGSSFTIQADQFALVSDDETQTTTPFAVDTTTGVVTFNADVEIDGDLIASGTITTGVIQQGGVNIDRLTAGVIENITGSIVSSVFVAPQDSDLVVKSVNLPAPSDTSLGHKPLVLVKLEWNIIQSTNWDDDGGDLPEVEVFINTSASGGTGRLDTYYYTHPTFNDTNAQYEKFSATLIGFSDTAITSSQFFYVKANVTNFDTGFSQDKIAISKCDVTVIGVR